MADISKMKARAEALRKELEEQMRAIAAEEVV